MSINPTFPSSVERPECTHKVRQHNSCSIYKQTRENTIKSTMLPSMGLVENGSKESDNVDSSSFIRDSRYAGGRFESLKDKAHRVDTEQCSSFGNISFMGHTNGRPVCFRGKRKAKIFCSWIPSHLALATDALSVSWENMEAYAFPPICLIPKVLQHMKRFQCQLILIAPQWPRRSWYTNLLQTLIACPVKLPIIHNMLYQPKTTIVHPNPQVFNLIAWLL